MCVGVWARQPNHTVSYHVDLSTHCEWSPQSPAPHIIAVPIAANILEWRFCLYGLKDCEYAGECVRPHGGVSCRAPVPQSFQPVDNPPTHLPPTLTWTTSTAVFTVLDTYIYLARLAWCLADSQGGTTTADCCFQRGTHSNRLGS